MKKALSNYLHSLTVDTAQHYRNMAVFPLLSDKEGSTDYLLLEEALEDDLIIITEANESGTVPELKVENKSERSILILDGEELVGAKQNRIVNVTILIAAHSKLTIPVSCVEQGRWTYQSQRFKSKERVMPSRMRMKKSAAVNKSLLNCGSFMADQGEIWNMIENRVNELQIDAPTYAMGKIYEQEEDIIDEYLTHYQPRDTQVGIMVMINDRVIGCDCFGKHETLKKTFPKLVKSYVIDAIDVNPGKKEYSFPKEKALGFVDELKGCLAKERPSISLGTDVRLASRKVTGSALAKDNEILHLTAFLKDEKEAAKKVGFYQRATKRRRSEM